MKKIDTRRRISNEVLAMQRPETDHTFAALTEAAQNRIREFNKIVRLIAQRIDDRPTVAEWEARHAQD